MTDALRVDPTRHITTLLTAQNPWEGAAKTLERYRGLPEPIGSIVVGYARNIRFVGLHYSYPARIYVDWMGGRIKDLLPEMSPEEAAQKFAAHVDQFIENRSKGVMKDAAYAHAISSYMHLWSIFETFLRGFTREAINLYPQLLSAPTDPDVVKPVEKSVAKLGTLGGSTDKDGVTVRLGDLLVPEKQSDIKNLYRLIRNFDKIGKSPQLQTALADDWLIKLEKRRHIVVHKAGFVDDKYVSDTGEGTPGEPIIVSPFDIMRCFKATHSVAFELCAEFTDYHKSPPA